MYYIVNANKSFEAACTVLQEAVQSGGFGVLHVHDLGLTLRNKGQRFAEECRVFEVCNPAFAAQVLAQDMRLNMVLPCRISVYTENGHTLIGMLPPMDLLPMLSDDETARQVAAEVDHRLKQMIAAACH
jgi:uncharacterized protein (DUF302 family)